MAALWGRMQSRLEDFRAMKDGWLDGEGKAPTAAALKSMEALGNYIYADTSGRNQIEPTLPWFPHPEGGVEFEIDPMIIEVHADGSVALFPFYYPNSEEEVPDPEDDTPAALRSLVHHNHTYFLRYIADLGASEEVMDAVHAVAALRAYGVTWYIGDREYLSDGSVRMSWRLSRNCSLLIRPNGTLVFEE